MGLVAQSEERMKGRSQGGWQLQHSLFNPCVEGKAPSSSPADPLPRPSRLSCPCPALGVTRRALHTRPSALRGEPFVPGLLLTSTTPFSDPACVTSESTQLPKGSPLPNPCPPPGSTLNPAEIAGAPLALENRRPTRTGLSVQRWASATNQPGNLKTPP